MADISNNGQRGHRANQLAPAPVIKGTPLPLTIVLPGRAGTLDFSVTRITHACVLLRWGDCAILTDPWFSQKTLYRHGESLPLGLDDLPTLSAVFSSMNHYDHFDIATFSGYRDLSVPLVTIKGSRQAAMAQGVGFTKVHELAGWASLTIGDVTFHAIPANRFAPNTFRYEQAYVIQAFGSTILFCAHYLKEHAVAQVKTRFPKIDLALLGINGLRIKPLMGRQMSMDPADAARLCAELQIPICVPIHYAFNGGWLSSTFLLSHKGTPEQFSEAVRRVSPGTSVVTLSPGQPLRLVSTLTCSAEVDPRSLRIVLAPSPRERNGRPPPGCRFSRMYAAKSNPEFLSSDPHSSRPRLVQWLRQKVKGARMSYRFFTDTFSRIAAGL